MGKFLSFFVATMLVCSGVSAQTGVLSPTAQPGLIAAPTVMLPSMFFVNMKSAPRGFRGGSGTYDFSNTTTTQQISTTTNADGVTADGGDFRIGCRFSHVAKDDPIVYPGKPGASHLHIFFGNTTTSANSGDDFSTFGLSTCAGGKLNRTGYWTPALIYSCPAGTVGCNRARDGEIQTPSGSLFYYKAAGGFNTDSIEWFPPKFRFITGSSTNNDPALLPGRVDCYTTGGGGPPFPNIPSTAQATAIGCYQINLFINFPVCWDGVNIDSPNHRSHTTGDANGAPFYVGCAAAYPGAFTHQFPGITLNIHYDPVLADLDFLRFSSDQPRATATGPCATAQYNYCAGATMHADWHNGWDRTPNFNGFGEGTITDIMLKYIYNKGYAAANGGLFRKSDAHANFFKINDPTGPQHITGSSVGGNDWHLD